MDYSWFSHLYGFWIFPLLCFIFMAVMMLACGAMCLRFGHRSPGNAGREIPREILERHYASGEFDKDRFEAVRRDVVALTASRP